MKSIYATILACVFAAAAPAAERTQTFDIDPNWDALNNHVVPTLVKSVDQHFGYSATHFAGKDEGEIGGTIWRSSTPASYAAKIPAKTLDEKLSASGTFALKATSGSSGAFFGWFNSEQTGAARQSTLGFRFAGQGAGARLTLQLVTGKNQACGTKVTQWEVDKTKQTPDRKVRPPSIKNNGTQYMWTLDYDPKGNGGDGRIQFTIHSNSAHPEAFEGKTFTIDLPKGYKEQGTSFDRFGLMNSMKGGNPLTLYFDDVQYNGKSEDFSEDPSWIGSGNQSKFEDRVQGGTHDFGFSAKSNCAGAAPGEMGGMLWRSGAYGYYADRVGPLSLNDRLEASGKVVLQVGSPDSGMYLGWFNSADKENAPTQAGHFVGVKIGGPTRVGHYFLPAYATAKQTPLQFTGVRKHPANIAVERGAGPILVPKKVFDWKLVYDPAANGGKGTITATLGDESITLALKNNDKAKGASLDRFGLFTTHRGGSYVKIYFDNLKYTVGSEGS